MAHICAYAVFVAAGTKNGHLVCICEHNW